MQQTARRQQPANVRLWYGMLAGPVLWSSHLLLCYLLVNTACGGGTASMRILLGVITGVVEAPIALAGWLAYVEGHRYAGVESARVRFMAQFGVLASIMFFIATLFTASPIFFLNACPS